MKDRTMFLQGLLSLVLVFGLILTASAAGASLASGHSMEEPWGILPAADSPGAPSSVTLNGPQQQATSVVTRGDLEESEFLMLDGPLPEWRHHVLGFEIDELERDPDVGVCSSDTLVAVADVYRAGVHPFSVKGNMRPEIDDHQDGWQFTDVSRVGGPVGTSSIDPTMQNTQPVRAAGVFPVMRFAVGSAPHSVALGDLNGDGRLDIITANRDDNTVSVLMGNGDGTFADQYAFGVGSAPHSVAPGDLNKDGHLDIVIANRDDNTVSVLMGNGDGTFDDQSAFGVGSAPHSVALGDLNGDGRLDIITANRGDNTVSVLLGNGDGTFGTQTTFAVGSAPYAVAIGDLNGDGYLDIVTANASDNTVSVLLNNGDGAFADQSAFGVGSAPHSVALGDLNGDGCLDIITANRGDNTVSVLLSNGDGTFADQSASCVGSGPMSVALGDVNEDAYLDIVTANSWYNDISVLLGSGDGTLTTRANSYVGHGPRSVILGDLNGNGHLDIVTANPWHNNISVLLGNGDGTFPTQTTVAVDHGPYSIVLGDLDGNGRLDIVTANRGDNTVSVLLGNGDGTFADQSAFSVGSGPVSVAVGDLNGDGHLDIVTANEGGGSVSVLLGDGNGTFTAQTTFATGSHPSAVALGDLNGDGRLDIVTANEGGRSVSVLLGNGDGTFATQTAFTVGSYPHSVAVGDLNGDGHLDIVTANRGHNNVSVLLGDGNGTFGTQTTFAVGRGPCSLALGDLNEDGHLDIVTANFWDGSTSVLLGNGDGTFGTQMAFAVSEYPLSIAMGDINGNGHLDMATSNFMDKSVSVLLGNVDGTFGPQTTFAAGHHPSCVALGDLNGDGRVDIVTANFGENSVSVLLQQVGKITHDPRAVTPPPVDAMALRFPAEMDRSSFSVLDDINAFTGPWGSIAVTHFSWADSRTLVLSFEPQWAAGSYEMSIGPDILDVWGRPMADAYLATFVIQAPAVVRHSPSGYVGAPVGALRFDFSHAMDTTSFSIMEDIASFSGPDGNIAATGFGWLDSKTLEVTFDGQYTPGIYGIVLGPHIRDLAGNPMDQNGNLIAGEIPDDQYSASFTITAPKIVAATPHGIAVPPVSSVRFHFDRPMDTTSFSIGEDIAIFTGPDGDIAATGFSWLDSGTLEVTFESQYRSGAYEMVVGPYILDLAGNPMDQDGDLVPGEIPDDQYVARFTLAYSGTLTDDTSWGPEQGVIVVDGDLTIASGVSLTIEAGTILKFSGGSSGILVHGSLNVLGTPAERVILTSFQDDSAGGDTNGDGGATVPQAGNWQGLRFESNATGTLSGVDIRYAITAINADANYTDVHLLDAVLRNNVRGIYIWSPFARIEATNCLMANNRQEAIFMRASSRGVFRNCTIVGNGFHGGYWAAIHIGAAALIFDNCIIAFNRNGVNHTNADPGDATVRNCAFYNPDGQNLVWGTSAPMPNLGENGNMEADPRFVNREAGDYELDAGSPCIDAGRGFGAPTSDILGRPRYDDRGMPNVGYGFPSYVDIGAFERQEDTAAGDLAVTYVSAPAPAFVNAGDSFTAEWTVTNVGLTDCAGSWVDRVYLSTDPYLSADDILLEERTYTGELSSGASYTATLTAVAQAITGPRYVIVHTNAERSIFDPVEANNVRASAGVLGVNVPILTLETPVTGTVAHRQWSYIRFDAAPGNTVRFNLDATATTGSTGLYLRYSLPPTLSKYLAAGTAYNQPDQEARLLEPLDGPYYIGVYGSTGETSYALSAELAIFGISSVSPTQVDNSGHATIKITGNSFSPDGQVYMVAPDGVTHLDPLQVYYLDPGHMLATFDFAGVDSGYYDMVLVNAESEMATLTDAIEIMEESLLDFEARISMPAVTRPGRVIDVRIDYTNTGLVDIRSPVLTLTGSEEDCEWRLPWEEEWVVGPKFRIMGLSSEGFPTVLRPGQSESIVIKLRVPLRPGPLRVVLSSVGAVPTDGSNTLIDWDMVEDEIRPKGVHPAIWATVFADLRSQIGDTWGDYVETLRQNAERLHSEGRVVYSVRQLFAMEMDRAYGTGVIAGHLVDAETDQPIAWALMIARQEVDGETSMIRTAQTGTEGEFAIHGLLTGTYELYAEGYYFEETPVYALTSDTDVSGLLLHAKPVPPQPEPQPVHINALDPSLTMDADGRLHMVWRQNAEIWHSYLDDTGWVDAAPIPGAEGLYPSIAAAGNLVDGTDPGLIVTWQCGQGNASDIRYAIGLPVEDGGFEWSEPVSLTDDEIHDTNPVLLIDVSGQALILYQKSDWSIVDDTDLYYDFFSVSSAGLVWMVESQAPEQLLAAAATGVSFSLPIKLIDAAPIPQWIPVIGGSNRFSVDGTLSGGRNCDAWAHGDLEAELVLFNRMDWRIVTSIEADWVTDKRNCAYQFDRASLSTSFGLSADIPVFGVYAIPPVAHAEAGLTIAGSMAGTATWAGSNFPSRPTGGDVSLGVELGVYGEAWLLHHQMMKARLEGKGRVEAQVLPAFRVSKADLSLDAFGRFFVWEFHVPLGSWSLYEGTANQVLLNGNAILEALVFTYNPQAGTGSIYGPNSILADVSDDLYNDGPPALAIGPSGEILLAWAKELDPASGRIGDAVMVSGWDGSAWSEPLELPDSLGFNSGVAIVFDSSGNPVVVWTHSDSSSVNSDSTTEELVSILMGGAIVHSVRTDGGWSAPLTVTTMTGSNAGAAVDTTHDDRVLLTWRNHTDSGARLMASLWNGSTWTMAEEIARSNEIIGAASVGQMGNETVVFWSQDTNDDPNISELSLFYSKYDGAWSVPELFSPYLSTAKPGSTQVAENTTALPSKRQSLATGGIRLGYPPEECCDEDPDDPDPEDEDQDEKKIERPPSITPEDKFGPAGYDVTDVDPSQERRFIRPGQVMEYRIEFWNDEEAIVPTQDAVIYDVLDRAVFDISTLELTRIGFLAWDMPLPGGQTIDARIDCQPEMNIAVEVRAGWEMEVFGLDDPTGKLVWWFHCIDPITGDYPEDPMAGFLPPFNPQTEYELGWVEFRVKAWDDLPTGTRIENHAFVQFDFMPNPKTGEAWGPAPPEGPWINTIDAGRPTSQVHELPETVSPTFDVFWSGQDDEGGSGIAGYDIFFRKNKGSWSLWLRNTPETSAYFEGEAGHTYCFYSIAIDNVGHREDKPAVAEATTTTGDLLFIITTELPDGQLGVAYEVTLEATGGTAPYTWAKLVGLLPPDLDLDAETGVISGIPRQADTFSFTVQVTDAAGQVATRSFALTVHADEQPALEGQTREVDCNILAEVNVELYQNDTVIAGTISDGDGSYTLSVHYIGEYRLVASKDGFRAQEQTISVNEPKAYAVNFVGSHGLIPNAPNVSYVLKCVNQWQFGTPPCKLDLPRVLLVINAWQFPVADD